MSSSMMVSSNILLSIYCLPATLFMGIANADHHHGYEPAYVYPETDYSYAAPDNTSLGHHGSKRSRRIFDQGLLTASASLTFTAEIPLTDLNSAVYITVPFSFSFPSERSSGATGRSFSGGLAGGDSPRSYLYRNIERYMGHMTGADGHQCLLRAMCEASSTPLHEEGFLGDAVTFLLTANYATEESDQRFKKYFAAQAKGQLTGDCSEWHAECPISLFKFIDDNIV